MWTAQFSPILGPLELCDLGQVTQSLCVLASSPTHRKTKNTCPGVAGELDKTPAAADSAPDASKSQLPAIQGCVSLFMSCPVLCLQPHFLRCSLIFFFIHLAQLIHHPLPGNLLLETTSARDGTKVKRLGAGAWGDTCLVGGSRMCRKMALTSSKAPGLH